MFTCFTVAAVTAVYIAAKPQSSSPAPAIVDQAAVGLQASYNVKEALLGVPSRMVGTVRCELRKRVSPSAVTVFCTGRAVGPHGAGGCFQVVGTFYSQLAAFATAASVLAPCPGDGV